MPVICADAVGDNLILRRCSFEDFAEAVYAMLQLLPPGVVVTYASIAKVLGVSARLVANVLRKNPNPIVVPCHKVVKADLRLGGYTLFGRKSPAFKAKLLRNIEGIELRVGGRVRKNYVKDIAELLGHDP